jgi:hypothetical protein
MWKSILLSRVFIFPLLVFASHATQPKITSLREAGDEGNFRTPPIGGGQATGAIGDQKFDMAAGFLR